MLVKFLEKFGIFFFIISILIISQLRWAQNFHFDDINLRVTFCFILSIFVFFGIMKILESKYINSDNVSFALSFSILGIYLNSNQGLLILLIIIVIIYYIKKSKSNSWFEEFWGNEDYKIKFDSGNGNARIVINSKNDLNIFRYKYLFKELINCIISCKENNITKIYLVSEETNKINHIISDLFDNFGIEADIVNGT